MYRLGRSFKTVRQFIRWTLNNVFNFFQKLQNSRFWGRPPPGLVLSSWPGNVFALPKDTAWNGEKRMVRPLLSCFSFLSCACGSFPAVVFAINRGQSTEPIFPQGHYQSRPDGTAAAYWVPDHSLHVVRGSWGSYTRVHFPQRCVGNLWRQFWRTDLMAQVEFIQEVTFSGQ